MGQVVKMAPESLNIAHASPSRWRGNTNINDRSIGIEIQHRKENHAYQEAQYTALISLLARLTDTYSTIENRNIIGHSDIAVHRGSTKLGRKKGDPGIYFDWLKLESANFGLIPNHAIADPEYPYGDFFHFNPEDVLESGDNDAQNRYACYIQNDVTDDPITQIQTDLDTIGYSVGAIDGDYGGRTQNAVEMFQEHFFCGDRHGRTDGKVDRATAIMIKRVLNGL